MELTAERFRAMRKPVKGRGLAMPETATTDTFHLQGLRTLPRRESHRGSSQGQSADSRRHRSRSHP